MNFYGSEKHQRLLKQVEQNIFSKCDMTTPTSEEVLDYGYILKRYYCTDGQEGNIRYFPYDGEICRLFQNENLIFEWKNINGHSRMANIIEHSDGNRYLIFDEALYGYSVLNLNNLECVHYIPSESEAYFQNLGGFKETFIWCKAHYDKASSLLAVEGCFWAAPYSIIVLDFSNPMEIVESDKWFHLCDEEQELDFVRWDDNELICSSLTIKKEELLQKI